MQSKRKPGGPSPVEREEPETMAKRIILSALAGAVVIFMLAGLFFGLLFADFFSGQLPEQFAGIQKNPPNFGA